MQKISSRLNGPTIFHNSTIRQFLIIALITAGSFSKASTQTYFQQEVNYSIQVTLNDKKHELSAFETIEYVNHSPDTLNFLYFHLWPNGYSDNKTELGQQLFGLKGKQKLFKDPELKGYIDSLHFKVNNQQVQWNLLPEQPDICRISLNKAIKHGDTITITTPFHVKIPKGVTSRLGHMGESYQISQWFPKPAVYDRTGWHQFSYQDQGEFYSEFGSFDVSITLPANYIVGATGTLQNAKEAEMLDQLAADTSWISASASKKGEFPLSSSQTKTLRYTEKNIHDFAWFADKRFHVLKGKVKLPESGREVTTWVMFTDQQADIWKGAIPFVNEAIAYFSKWNGDYPYHSFTAVQGALGAGDGMEYPLIAVIGTVKDAYSLDEVIAHEICHNWYYSALGSDERRYPFMDEGITSANEMRYMQEKYPEKKLWEIYFNKIKLAKFFHIDKMPVLLNRELEWLSLARENLEQPVNLPSSAYSSMNYSLLIYDKAGKGFNYLRAYLGDSLYDATMHEYFRVWKFKHPDSNDLQKVFEDFTGKDLTWFFKDFLGTTKRMDYAAIRLENQRLLVKNKDELNSPLVICGMRGDSIGFEQWVDGFEGEKWIKVPPGDYTEIKIDPQHVTPELFRLNNNIRKSGIFPKADPLLTQLYLTLEDPEKRYLMFFPAANWTRENGFMVGIALNNGHFTPKKFEYFILPFYTFKPSGLAGYGKMTYNITPYDKLIRKASFSVDGTQFGAPGNQNYQRLKFGTDLYFRPAMNSNISQKVYGNFIAASDLSQILKPEKAGINSYLQFGYQLEKSVIVNPFFLHALLETGPSYAKTSALFLYRLSYEGKKNGLDFRLFIGTMLKNNSKIPFYALAPGGRSGRQQYLYQGTYPDRFGTYPTSLWSRQMAFTEGGLVSPVNDQLGYSQRLVSLSLTSSLPGKISRIPVKPFINILLNDHGTGSVNGSSKGSPVFYEAGIKAGFWNFFEIYFPLLVSPNIESLTGRFNDRIRLVFSLESLNQIKLNSGVGIKIQ